MLRSYYQRLLQHQSASEKVLLFGGAYFDYSRKQNEDLVITKAIMEEALKNLSVGCEAIIIRTLPNPVEKTSKNYSHTNPPYLAEGATQLLVEKGIQHLLIDLPSVDRESD